MNVTQSFVSYPSSVDSIKHSEFIKFSSDPLAKYLILFVITFCVVLIGYFYFKPDIEETEFER